MFSLLALVVCAAAEPLPRWSPGPGVISLEATEPNSRRLRGVGTAFLDLAPGDWVRAWSTTVPPVREMVQVDYIIIDEVLELTRRPVYRWLAVHYGEAGLPYEIARPRYPCRAGCGYNSAPGLAGQCRARPRRMAE